jgi:hypothetical protein
MSKTFSEYIIKLVKYKFIFIVLLIFSISIVVARMFVAGCSDLSSVSRPTIEVLCEIDLYFDGPLPAYLMSLTFFISFTALSILLIQNVCFNRKELLLKAFKVAFFTPVFIISALFLVLIRAVIIG